jgi:hypothetical protein
MRLVHNIVSNIFDAAKQILAEGSDREAYHEKAFDHHYHQAELHQKQFHEMHRQLKNHLDSIGKGLPNHPEDKDMHFLRELHDAVQYHFAKANEHDALADMHARAINSPRPRAIMPKAK